MKKIFPLLFCCLCALSANATRFYVNKNATGTGTGTSWANAYTNLSTMLNQPIAGDEVWVAAADYRLGSVFGSFSFPNGVKVYGGFSGIETVLSQRDWVNNSTVLNGLISASHVDHVVYFSSGTVDTRLDGFKIINGGDTDINGGGILIGGGSAIIANCSITNNQAQNGGGIYVTAGSPTFDNCYIGTNTSTGSGGGIYILGSSGSVKMLNCTLKNNTSGYNGGAIVCYGALILNRATISGNTATEKGSAIYNYDINSGIINVYNSIIIGNVSQNSIIYTGGGAHKIINCTISDNLMTATAYRALNITSTSVLQNNIIWNNTINNYYGIAQYCTIQGVTPSVANFLYNNHPLFINASDPSLAPFNLDSYDYHLQSNSPCINTGSINYLSNLYTTDLEGNPRTQGGAPDLGCYESTFVSTENTENATPITMIYANDNIYIAENEALRGQKLHIYGINGVLLETKIIDSDIITLQNLANGTYIAKIQNQSLKFVVVK